LNRDQKVDSRGLFERLYCMESLNSILGSSSIRQINHSKTFNVGTVRGLHFQFPPYSETKIITCMRGKVFDVVVDIRKESQTFLKHFSILLSENSSQSLIVPQGFAHGFQALSPSCELLYMHTADYKADAEGTLNIRDHMLEIQWPISIGDQSEKDKNAQFLKSGFAGI